jgi:O-antigen ligase
MRLPSPLILSIVPFYLWSVVSFFWTINPTLTEKRLFTYTLLLVLVSLIWEFANEPRSYVRLMQAYVLGAVVSVMVTLKNYASGHQVGGYFRYAADNFDPNDLAVMLALAIPMAWYVALGLERHPNRWIRSARWIYFLFPVLSVGGILLTASRTGLIAAGVGLMIIPWTLRRLSFRSKSIMSAAMIVFAAVVPARVPAHTWDRLATTTTELTSGTLNRRTVIWEGGITAYSDRPIFGAGAGAFRTASAPYLLVDHAAHNAFLSILVETGLVGFLLFVAVLAMAGVFISRMPPLGLKLWLLLSLIWGAGANTLAWEDHKPTWLLLALLALHSAAAQRPTGGTDDVPVPYARTGDDNDSVAAPLRGEPVAVVALHEPSR